ncbi:MAG: hypothetical protein ACRD43_12540 [Pyrinomonadaceae bacterium]
MRNTKTQNVIVEGLRRDIQATNDPVSVVIVEAFDNAHRNRLSATAIKGFADLIGDWKRVNYLLAERSPGGNSIGVAFTDSGSLQIMQDGGFKLVKVHDHYENGCSRQDAMTETGRVSINGAKLVFLIGSGSRQTKEGCSNQMQRIAIRPQTAAYSWSVRPSPNDERSTMLCINIDDKTSECYEKQ